MTLSIRLAAHHALLSRPLHGDDPTRHVRRLAASLDDKPAGMDRYARLDRYGKALAHVCAQVSAPPRTLPPGTGLAVASLHSCHETNSQFDAELIAKGPRSASPLLFPYTLPGAAAAEVAMHLGLVGPYSVFPGGADAALAALLTASEGIDASDMPACVVATSDVLGTSTLEHLRVAGALPQPPAPPLAEGAVAVLLAHPGEPLVGPLVALDAALGPGNPNNDDLLRLAHEAIERAELSTDAVTQLVSATTDLALVDRERHVLESLPRVMQPLHLGWRLGDAGASLGLLALLAALEGSGPALVLACTPSASIAVAVRDCSLWHD
ncbi:MAG: hypothetical protein AAB426_04870 [Myxococcota bacterium]